MNRRPAAHPQIPEAQAPALIRGSCPNKWPNSNPAPALRLGRRLESIFAADESRPVRPRRPARHRVCAEFPPAADPPSPRAAPARLPPPRSARAARSDAPADGCRYRSAPKRSCFVPRPPRGFPHSSGIADGCGGAAARWPPAMRIEARARSCRKTACNPRRRRMR